MTYKKLFNRYLPLTLSVLLLAGAGLVYLFLNNNAKPADAAWYNSSWGYRKAITIDHNKVSGTASSTINSFPVLINVTDSDLKYTGSGGKVGRTDGLDILFTSSDGSTKLDHEIEKYASTTGETVAWVRVPVLSAVTDTTIYIYFGNSGASDQSNKTGVWDSSTKLVQHLGNGSTLSVSDSTTLNSPTNNSAAAATGKIDGAASFNGSSQYIDDGMTINYGQITVEAWFNSSNVSNNNSRIVGNSHTDIDGKGFQLMFNSGGTNGFFDIGNGADRAASWTQKISNNTWYHYIGTYDGTNVKAYINGILVGTSAATSGSITASGSNVNVGRAVYAGDYFAGTIDEVRISNTARNFDWIATEYNNQNSPSTFYAYGAVSIQNRAASTPSAGFSSRGTSSLGWYNASWTYRKPITIDHNKVFGVSSSTINSFPILFSVIDSDLKYTGSGGKMASSTGGDLLFTASDGTTKLDFEVEKYASTTGETLAWVRIPILSSATDTTLYIYFGNNSATNQQNPTGVWDSNFKIVQHLGNGTTLSATDSTSNAVNGTISTPTATTGLIDGGASFNGSSDVISFSTTTAFATTGAGFTASFWGLITTFASNSYQHAWTIKSNGASSRPWEMTVSNQSSYLGLLIGSSNDWAVVKTDYLPSTNAWHHYVATYNGSGASTVANFKLYEDGVLQNNSLPAGFSALTNTTQIGPTSGGGSNFWQGKLDEMRFSSTERNADWIKTEYGNQFSPSTFYSYGALQINGRQNSGGVIQPAVKSRGGVKFR